VGFFTESAVISNAHLGTPQCGLCGLHSTCLSPYMETTGEGRRKILVVAEAPGREEDKQDIQLVGESGQLFRKVLASHDVDLDRDCWKTNAIVCRPPDNEKPTKNQLGYCFPNLIDTIRRLEPEVILLLGGVAVDSLVGYLWGGDVGNVTRWVGWKIPSQRLNAWVCPTYHPAFLLRSNSPALDLWFGRHVEAALSLSGRPYSTVPDYASQVDCVFNPITAAKILRKMREKGGTIAFDYETNMLKPDGEDARIHSCAVCWEGKKTIAYPWTMETAAATRELLRDDRTSKLGWSMKFEERWTRAILGCKTRGWETDGMVLAHVLDHRRHITSAKFQAFVRLGQPLWSQAVEPFLKAPSANKLNRIYQVDTKDLLLYNGMDALLEYVMVRQQQEELNWL